MAKKQTEIAPMLSQALAAVSAGLEALPGPGMLIGGMATILRGVFLEGQFSVGAGIGTYVLDMELANAENDTPSLATVQGTTAQLGAVWSPEGIPLRAGASVRIGLPKKDGVGAEQVEPDENGNYIAEGYYFPREITAPTVLETGVALQFFRPMNGAWIEPPRRGRGEHQAAPEYSPPDYAGRQRHLLLVAGLRATLPVERGVGLESCLVQRVQRSGRQLTLSPRFGVEGEPWINALVMRGGGYFEPARISSASPRLHLTAGTDVHVPVEWTVFGLLYEHSTFRLGGAVDRAWHYFGWSLSLGVWH